MLLKNLFPTVVFILSFFMSFGQNDEKAREYINTYSELAIKEMMRTGVPASITLAQGILESQYGESDLARRSNNHFGIKCKTEWTGEKVYHDDDARGECFRKYVDVEQSYIDHSDFLKTRAHYAFLFNLDPTDYEGWAKGLKKAGYATNPSYAQRLINLINRYNLQEYTLIALQRANDPNADVGYARNENAMDAIIPADPVAASQGVKKEKQDQPVTVSTAANREAVEPVMTTTANNMKYNYPQGVFYINTTKVIYAKQGISLLALANEYNISYKNLLDYNELDDATDILAYDQLIYLAKKPKKGIREYHVVESGETIELIAQRQGVLLESLISYNRIPKGKQPAEGEKIYLRANSPVTPKLVALTGTN